MFTFFLMFLPILAIVTAKIVEWEVCWANGAFADVPQYYSQARAVYHWVYILVGVVCLVTSFSSNFGFLVFLIVFIVSGASGVRSARRNLREQGHPIRYFGGPFD